MPGLTRILYQYHMYLFFRRLLSFVLSFQCNQKTTPEQDLSTFRHCSGFATLLCCGYVAVVPLDLLPDIEQWA